MKICDVCGIPFEVRKIEANGSNDPCMGRSEIKYSRITLAKEMSKPISDSTLIHEWIHAVLDSSGFGDVSNDEKLISVLQNELYRAGFRVPVKEVPDVDAQ